MNGEISGIVNDFGWRYFKSLNRRENIFCSPYSIAAALSVIATGALFGTRLEILSALGADSIKNLDAGFKKFRGAVDKNYSGENVLRDANLLLINKNFIGGGISPTFESVVKNIYGAEIRVADFNGDLDGERQKISAWVDEKTNHFISNFQAELTAETIVNLLNVIYFKGAWQFPFKEYRTAAKTFTNRDGSKSRVQMMHETFDCSICYHSDENFRGVRLPYENQAAAMYFILSKNKWSLNVAEEWGATTSSYKKNFIAQLDTVSMLNGQIYMGNFEIEIPRFEFDIENNLVENLNAVGISRAFTNDAEFCNIVENVPLKIDSAIHRTKIKVDETGTESAAASELNMIIGCANPLAIPVVEFHADRPFVFMIRDVQFGLNLFAGVVNTLK